MRNVVLSLGWTLALLIVATCAYAAPGSTQPVVAPEAELSAVSVPSQAPLESEEYVSEDASQIQNFALPEAKGLQSSVTEGDDWTVASEGLISCGPTVPIPPLSCQCGSCCECAICWYGVELGFCPRF